LLNASERLIYKSFILNNLCKNNQKIFQPDDKSDDLTLFTCSFSALLTAFQICFSSRLFHSAFPVSTHSNSFLVVYNRSYQQNCALVLRHAHFESPVLMQCRREFSLNSHGTVVLHQQNCALEDSNL